MRQYQWIGAASGWGAQIRSCEEGPERLQAIGPHQPWAEKNLSFFAGETLCPSVRASEKDISLKEALPLITAINHRLSDAVFAALDKGKFPVVVGGDHSLAVGTWNGVGQFFSANNMSNLGLIWIDAHMDSHTPETTPSGAWHGMPLAALLGYGKKELAQLKRPLPIVKPENLRLIGIRSFEEGEAKLLEKLNVKVYFMDEVRRRGFSTVLKEAIEHVAMHTDGYGVSLDVDVVDPAEAPGVGSPEPGGLFAKELLAGLPLFCADPRLKAFELVEFNPSRDQGDATSKLCFEILREVFSLNTRST